MALAHIRSHSLDWKNEINCFKKIIKHLGKFYAVLPINYGQKINNKNVCKNKIHNTNDNKITTEKNNLIETNEIKNNEVKGDKNDDNELNNVMNYYGDSSDKDSASYILR